MNIDFEKMKQGSPLILLPDYFRTQLPQKMYFVFTTESYKKSTHYAQIIVAYNSEDAMLYQTLDDFQKNQRMEDPDKKYDFITDLKNIRHFSEYKFKKYQKAFAFIDDKKDSAEKILKWFYPLDEKKSIMKTRYYQHIKIIPQLYFIRFYLNTIIMRIGGLIKRIVFYPMVFVFDLFKLTFEKYISYRKTLNSLNTESDYFMMGLCGSLERDIALEKEKRRKEYAEAKKEYLNSNIALLTLIFSIIFFLITQRYNSNIKADNNIILEQKNKELKNQHENDMREIKHLNDKLTEIETKCTSRCIIEYRINGLNEDP
jgi:hypothetical protein